MPIDHMKVDEFFLDLQTVLNFGMELQVWQVPSKNTEFLKTHGSYGAVFYYPGDEVDDSSRCDYANSPEEAIVKAMKRWR
jgi:hypothetical protein